MTSDRAAPKPLAPPPAADPFLLFWDELLQMPRILWTCWYDAAADAMMSLAPPDFRLANT